MAGGRSVATILTRRRDCSKLFDEALLCLQDITCLQREFTLWRPVLVPGKLAPQCQQCWSFGESAKPTNQLTPISQHRQWDTQLRVVDDLIKLSVGQAAIHIDRQLLQGVSFQPLGSPLVLAREFLGSQVRQRFQPSTTPATWQVVRMQAE